jgi:hypothetical protein
MVPSRNKLPYTEVPTYLSPCQFRNESHVKQIRVFHIHCKTMTSDLQTEFLRRTAACCFFSYKPDFPDAVPPLVQPPGTFVLFGVFAALPWFIFPKASHLPAHEGRLEEGLLLPDLPSDLQESIIMIEDTRQQSISTVANENVAIYAFCYGKILQMYTSKTNLTEYNVYTWEPLFGHVWNHVDNIFNYRKKRLEEMRDSDEFGLSRKSKKIDHRFQALGFFPWWVEARNEFRRIADSQFLEDDINGMFSVMKLVNAIEKELVALNDPYPFEYKLYKAWFLVQLFKEIGINPRPWMEMMGCTSQMDTWSDDHQDLDKEVPIQDRFRTNKYELNLPIVYGDPHFGNVATDNMEMDWYMKPQEELGSLCLPVRIPPYDCKIDTSHPNQVHPDKLVDIPEEKKLKLVVSEPLFPIPVGGGVTRTMGPVSVELTDLKVLDYFPTNEVHYPEPTGFFLETQMHGYLKNHVGSISLDEPTHDRSGFRTVSNGNVKNSTHGKEPLVLILPNGAVWTITYQGPVLATHLDEESCDKKIPGESFPKDAIND